MHRWNWFAFYNPKERPAVWNEVTLAGLSTSSHAACDVPPDTSSKLSRDVIPAPRPCLGKVLLGAWTGAYCCQDTFGPAASISIEDFPKLLMALVQVVQALSVLWETTCSCSGQKHTPVLWAGVPLHHSCL